MKKVAIITSGSLKQFGGAERHIISLTENLKGYYITVFYNFEKSYSTRSNLVSRPILKKAEIFNYNVYKIPLSEDRIPLTISGIKMLLRLRNYDVIYNVDASTTINLFLIIASKLFRNKYIFVTEDPAFLRDAPIRKGYVVRLLFKLYKNFRNFTFKHIPIIQVLDQDDKKILERIGYKNKIYTIPNFTTVDMRNLNKIEGAKKKKKFVVLFVGRLIKFHKGIDFLEQIIPASLKKTDNLMFHIVGRGELESEKIIKRLSRRYPDNVKWLKFVSDKKLNREYLYSDLLIQTSRFEGVSLVSIEAVSHGLPIIGFDVKGVRGVVKKLNSGRLITPFMIEDFVKAILNYNSFYNESFKKYITLRKIILLNANKYYTKDVVLKKINNMFK